MPRISPRKVGSRVPRNIVLIVVEGETESIYFEGLKERDSNIKIVLVKPGPADPVRIVEACIHQMKTRDMNIGEGDLAICAFDVDENPVERLVQAVKKAAESDILVALTNPCFELWLILHYQDVRDFTDRKGSLSLIKRHFPRYTKTSDLGAFLPLRNDAMVRSRNIMVRAGASSVEDLIELNPSSSMHLALEAIDALKERNRDRRAGCR